jgi:predicted phosphoribosyltransferase
MIPRGEFALFRDRHEAGQRLARKLLHYKDANNTMVIALPRGGVVVGYDIC